MAAGRHRRRRSYERSAKRSRERSFESVSTPADVDALMCTGDTQTTQRRIQHRVAERGPDRRRARPYGLTYVPTE